MTDSRKKSNDELPAVVVKKHRWGISVVWVVPIVAALVAAYLVYHGVTQFGPEITIEFKDGTGLKNGQTVIQYRGVKVGQVQSIELNPNHKSVLVRARLLRSASSLAREGSIFWVVRPQVGVGNISGLSTVISGSHIEVSPGQGKPKSEFVGQEGTPASLDPNGLKIILLTSRLGSVQINSPVYYRGVQVGTVADTTLSSNATLAEIHVLIKERYAT
jgi:paraquat-inducible protein B